MADLITNALKMHLLGRSELRQGVCVQDGGREFKAALRAGLKTASHFMNRLKPEMLLPAAMTIPRYLHVDLDQLQGNQS